MIIIAMPAANGCLHGHFGGCAQFTFVTADPVQRKIINLRTVPAPPHQPGLFPLWLREQGATVVIAGGIGHRAIALLSQYGIEVRAGLPGSPVEPLVTTYLNGELTATPEGCAHHGHHHDGDGHHHHDHA